MQSTQSIYAILSQVCGFTLFIAAGQCKRLSANVIHPVFPAWGAGKRDQIAGFYLRILLREVVGRREHDPQRSAAPKPLQLVPINTSIPHQHKKQHNGLARGSNKPQKTVQNASLPVHFHSSFQSTQVDSTSDYLSDVNPYHMSMEYNQAKA